MQVKVYGPGIEHGVLASYQSRFICDTRGAGAGQLTVRIRGPKGIGYNYLVFENLCHSSTGILKYEVYLIFIHLFISKLLMSPFQFYGNNSHSALTRCLPCGDAARVPKGPHHLM